MLFLLHILLLAISSFAVSVESMDEQLNNPSMIGLRTRIVNDSNETLRNVEMRFVFWKEYGKNFVVDSGYKPNAKITVRLVNDTIGYVSYFIDSIPKGMYPNMSGYSQGLHFSDWTEMNKKRNPSYLDSPFFAKNAKVLLFVDNVLVYGDASTLPKSKTDFKIVGFQPDGNAWIDIQNRGPVGEYLEKSKLIGSNGVSYELDSIFLDSMEILRICKNDTACERSEKRLILPNFAWGREGEALLKKDSLLLSYVPWGKRGTMAELAVLGNVWEDVDDYFAPMSKEFHYPIEYYKNVFFRIRTGDRGTSSRDWFGFSERDDPTKKINVPKPLMLTMNKTETYRLSSNEPVEFSWLPVEHVSRYKLIVRDNANQVHEIETSETSVKMNLPNGNISWIVYCDEYINQLGIVMKADENGNYDIDYANTILISREVDVNVWNALSIDVIKARKDSRLLNLGYGKDAQELGWDYTHVANKSCDWIERNHCWLTAAQLLNRLYGGNITQDEIEFAVRFDKNEPLMSPFSAGGGNEDDVVSALKFALQIEEKDISTYVGSPTYDYVKAEIDDGRPVLAAMKNHIMVIYGYVGTSDNYAFLYAYRGDNEGFLTNTLADSSEIIKYYFLNVDTGSVTKSDYRIRYDSDGDGVTNFDEEMRFGTNPLDYDSDGDGIDDKREIYNYTLRGSYSKDLFFLADRELAINANVVKNSDKNGNGIRAEMDSDDDGDGVNDGLIGSGSILNMDVPLNYTVYARDHLVINDGVKCYDSEIETDDYCQIGAAGKNIFSYEASPEVLSLGARTHVGKTDVFVKNYQNGKMMMRSNAEIHSDLNIFVKTPMDSSKQIVFNEDEYILKQQNAKIDGGVFFPMINRSWNDYLCNMSDLTNISYRNKKNVSAGERYFLKDGDAYESLKVENGGTLVVSPGEMYVDSLLQIEPNAKIEFLSSGESSVIHLNGRIIWRSRNNEPLTNTAYWLKVAKGFKIVQHSSKSMYMEGAFGGTIYAPLSKLVLGQDVKIIYGRFLAKDITIHQYSKVFRVDYNPTINSSYVRR